MNPNHPVVLVEDDEVLDEVLKLAAAAGCAVERVPDLSSVRRCWSRAPLVILDGASARDCADSGLSRRGSVYVVCTEPPRPGVWECAVSLGAERVILLPAGESALVGAFADVVEAPASTTGRVLAVVGGCGGAGASLFVASVGLTVLRRGSDALLVDCDPDSGGLDVVLGAENKGGLRWPDVVAREGRISASSLHAALPGLTDGRARLSVLSGDRDGSLPAPGTVAGVVAAGRRGGDTVICDVARSLDDAGCVVLDRADLTVVVVPAEVRACLAARLVATRLTDRGARPRLVVRGPAPGGLRAGDVAAAVGIPLLATMRPEPGVTRSLERGEFRPRRRGPLAGAAAVTLKALAEQPHREPVSAS